MMTRTLPTAMAALALLCGSGMSQAATITQTVGIGGLPISIGAGQSFDAALDPFARFDPSAGTLNSVGFASAIGFIFSGPETGDPFFKLSIEEPVTSAAVDGVQGGALGSSPDLYQGNNTFLAPFGPQADLFVGTGFTTLALQGFSTRALGITGFQATITYDYTPATTSVPEPASLALLGAGLLGLAAAGRRAARARIPLA